MAQYTFTLIDTIAEGGNVKSFVFQPDQPMEWQAGQYMHYKLPIDHPDAEGAERYFTIASAPHTGEPQITTRVTQTSFKQALNALKVGDKVECDGPSGSFTWVDDERPLLWVAGGIGITPFHSILAERDHLGLPVNVTLIYANRTGDIPFKAELEDIASRHDELKITTWWANHLPPQPLPNLRPMPAPALCTCLGQNQWCKVWRHRLNNNLA